VLYYSLTEKVSVQPQIDMLGLIKEIGNDLSEQIVPIVLPQTL